MLVNIDHSWSFCATISRASFKREFKVCGIQPKALLKGSTPLRLATVTKAKGMMFMSSAHHSSHVSTAGGFEPGSGS